MRNKSSEKICRLEATIARRRLGLRVYRANNNKNATAVSVGAAQMRKFAMRAVMFASCSVCQVKLRDVGMRAGGRRATSGVEWSGGGGTECFFEVKTVACRRESAICARRAATTIDTRARAKIQSSCTSARRRKNN